MNPIMEQLPESKRTADVEEALTALNINDMGSLADALVSARSALGETETIKGQLGEAKSKYETLVSDIPESSAGYGITATDDAGKLMLETFAESKVSKAAASRITAAIDKIATGANETAQQERETRLAEIKSSLGDKGFDLAKRGAEILYSGEDKAELRERTLSDPDIVPGLVIAGRVGIENPKIFHVAQKEGSDGDLYPGMTRRGMR